jgi:hypothetical protein
MFETFYVNVIHCVKIEYELRITGILDIIESEEYCYSSYF